MFSYAILFIIFYLWEIIFENFTFFVVINLLNSKNGQQLPLMYRYVT